MKRTRIDRFKVRQEMQRQNIATLQDLSKIANLNSNTLYSVIDGYSWRGATLDAIADALNVNPISLLTVDDADVAEHIGGQPARRANGHATRRPTSDARETALASQTVLAREWNTPEEDKAWADL